VSRRSRIYLVLLASVLLLTLTTAASARAVPHVPASYTACPVKKIQLNVAYYCQLEFSLRSSNGYRLKVAGEVGEGGVELSVEGPDGTAQYIANHGKVTATSIHASFGHLGEVSMRFRPSGKERHRHVSKKCVKNRPSSISSRLGFFVGTFKFRGERGYTHVAAHRVAGAIGDPLTNTSTKKIPCDFRESSAERQREDESVSLDATASKPKVSLSVFRLFGSWGNSAFASGHGPYLFLAAASEKSDGLLIIRTNGAFGTSSDFAFDSALTTATVTPPVPFTGTGTFQRNPDGSTTWNGNLAVPLPGLGLVGLTGGHAELATVATHLEQLEERLEKSRPGGH
jgi:hypothetical protein